MQTTVNAEGGLGRPDTSVWPGRAFQAIVSLLVAFLVLAPLLPLVLQAFIDRPLYAGSPEFSLAAFARLFTHAEFYHAVWNTAVFAVSTTVIAQFFGIAGTLLLARTDIPGRRMASAVFFWPLFVSHLVLAFGWIVGFGPSGFITGIFARVFGEAPWNLYSMAGLSFAAGTALAPLTYLYCASSVKTIDPALESAARISGCGPIRTLWTVTIPLLKPAIWSSASLNFMLAIELLSLPLLIGGPAGLKFLITFLYEEGIEANSPDYSLVAACSLLLIGVISLLLMWQARSMGDTRKYVTIAGKASRQRLLGLGKWKWPLFIVLVVYLGVTVVCVLGAVVLRASTSMISPYMPVTELLTFTNFESLIAFPEYIRSIINTALVALVGGAIGTVLIGATAVVSLRSNWPLRNVLQTIALYPRAVPGLLVGIGVFWAVAWIPGLNVIQNTIWILIFAVLMRHFPTGFGAVTPSLHQISQDLDRSARVGGATWFMTMRRIIVPQLSAPLAACFVLLVVHFIKEYASVVFLFGPGSEMIGTTMLSFWVQGEQGSVAALAVLQIAMVAILLGIFRLIFKVKLYG